jgi:hypothetical protein
MMQKIKNNSKSDGFINFGNRCEPEFIPIVDKKLFIFVGRDRGSHIGEF